MNQRLTVKNAYGRDFKSKKEILEHYKSNRDFQICFNLGIKQGSYINKQDAKKFEVSILNVRYNNLMKIAVIDVKKDNFQ